MQPGVDPLEAGAMIHLGLNSLEVFLVLPATDLRKSFGGLSSLVESHGHRVAEGGRLYVFANRRRDRIKLLSFDGTGLWVSAKRLEEGTFSWPPEEGSGKVLFPLRGEALTMLLDGIDLRGGQMRPWYQRG